MLEESRGATDVKQAEFIVDYTTTKPTAVAAANDSSFLWTPPVGAVLSTDNGAGGMGDQGSASTLVGKPPPDFTLKGLDDKPVKLSALKGSVVVLDFWATWCVPCVASLPHVDALYREQSPHGLKVFAVNVQEERDAVNTFVQEKKLSIPVLLDTPGDVCKKYGTEDGIPLTVIIGKDGIVKKAFAGTSEEVEQLIKDTVSRELEK
jgi:peroxiredoxin